MSACLNSFDVPLDPSLYGWKFVEKWWKPILYNGSTLPHTDYVAHESAEVDESSKADGLKTINELETV